MTPFATFTPQAAPGLAGGRLAEILLTAGVEVAARKLPLAALAVQVALTLTVRREVTPRL